MKLLNCALQNDIIPIGRDVITVSSHDQECGPFDELEVHDRNCREDQQPILETGLMLTSDCFYTRISQQERKISFRVEWISRCGLDAAEEEEER